MSGKFNIVPFFSWNTWTIFIGNIFIFILKIFHVYTKPKESIFIGNIFIFYNNISKLFFPLSFKTNGKRDQHKTTGQQSTDQHKYYHAFQFWNEQSHQV